MTEGATYEQRRLAGRAVRARVPRSAHEAWQPPGDRPDPIEFAWSVISVIEEENTDVRVQDEGAYLRVLVPRVCRLSRVGLVAATGSAIRFPGELEVVMSSFTGVMQLTEDGAVWRLAREPSAETAAPLAGGR